MRVSIIYLLMSLVSLSLFAQVEGAEGTEGSTEEGSNQQAAQSAEFEYPEPGNGYNPNSVNPIHESDIMWKKSVLRRIDLKEKMNKGFFASGYEITRILMEAVKNGVVTPYVNDSLTTVMPLEKFLENIALEDQGGGGDAMDDMFGDDGFGDFGEEEEEPAAPQVQEFLPTQITLLDLREDMIFDKKRSRLDYKIQSLTMIISGDQLISGINRAVCTFSYKELVEKVFRKNPDAIWFNRYNVAEHKNLEDAFKLRLFSGRIISISNPDNLYLADIYNKSMKQGLMASYWKEMELMEYEHNLWEY